ncbi:MAG TPA: site-2 protease family protein [Nannocystaceae bacterium]|nr:site-2 protease family protein [Nannocystaceae bacterium]
MGNLWAFILLIGPLIFFHELGHLIAAKLVDVKVIRFSIGFGPPLVRMRFGETEYCLAPIPLGGYVQMLGQMPGDDVPPQDQDRALSAKPLWARYFVLGAGPLANLVLPLFCFFFFFLQHTMLTPPIIGTVVAGSAAEQAGLVQGDRIVAIDGRDVRSWKEMSQRVAESPGVDLEVQIERDGKRLDRVVTPQKTMIRNELGVATPIGRLGVLGPYYAPQIGIIDPKSPAYLQGLRTGDTITSINGEPVRTVEQLQKMLDSTGDALVRLTYLRPIPVAAPLGTLLWYESAHAQLLPGRGGTGTGILPANAFVRSVEPGSPAARSGVRAGDRVLAIDGESLWQWEALDEVLEQRREQPVVLTLQSLGEAPRDISLQLEIRKWRDIYRHDRQELWFGAEPYAKIHFSDPEPIRGRFTYAVGTAVEDTIANARLTWTTLVQMLTFERGVEDLSSVVGLFKVAGTAADQGPGQFLWLVALLSINLGFVNLLPIPVLDGGHLLFFTVEAIRRRPLSQRAREIASAIGLVVILLLLLVAARNDIVRYWL